MSIMKKAIKKILQIIFLSKYRPIVIASMGRSGSTLVYDAVRESLAKRRFGPFWRLGLKIVSDTAWNLDTKRYSRGVVYKTHGLANELPITSNVRVVFLFGPASDSALSVLNCRAKYGDDWIQEHLQHLRADGKFEEIGERDVLRFSDQLAGWMGSHAVERLALHYDGIWDNQKTLSEFCGFQVELPPRLERTGAKNVDESTKALFKETYHDLDVYIDSLPRCTIIR